VISTVHSYPRDDWRGAGKNTATKWRMRKLGEIGHETVFAAGGRGEKSTHGIPGMNNGQTNDLTDAFFLYLRNVGVLFSTISFLILMLRILFFV